MTQQLDLLNGAAPPVNVLRDWLLDARRRTLELTQDLDGERMLGPRLAIVNPPLWELAHVAWFQEHWCLRQRGDGKLADSMVRFADWLYNSALIPHEARWDAPLLPPAAMRDYLERVLDGVLQRLERGDVAHELLYFAQLAVFHEDMHGEALFYTRQTHGYPAPKLSAAAPSAGSALAPSAGNALAPSAGNALAPSTSNAPINDSDVSIAGGNMLLGAPRGAGFVFDNEKWAHEVAVAPFRIARHVTSNAQFLQFVADGGYQRDEWWSEAGLVWRKQVQAQAPLYWRKQDGVWLQREYDQWLPLREHAPVIFVNWYEAQAYCRWAKRRLPTEAEWEFAAAMDGAAKRLYPWGNNAEDHNLYDLNGISTTCIDIAEQTETASASGCQHMIGNVWQWTADWFGPYPGFVADPYQEYSAPWFGDHKVLRGGCFASRSRLVRNTWRNFYTPDRRDVFAGFRTCAL